MTVPDKPQTGPSLKAGALIIVGIALVTTALAIVLWLFV